MRRRSGIFGKGGGERVGDHLCWSYCSDDEHRRVLTEYFTDGLHAQQRLAYFAPGGAETRLLAYLADSGTDPRQLIADGRLVVGRAEDAYTPDGPLDPDARIAAYRAMVEDALAEGYSGLRVAGEVGWLLEDPANRASWPGYEFRAGLLAGKLPFTALCCYDIRRCGREVARLMEGLHGVALNPSSRTFYLHGDPDGSIWIDGEVDYGCAETVKAALVGSLGEVGEGSRVCVDLSGLRFADIAGMRAIAVYAEAVSGAGGEVRVRGASRAFRRAWELLEFDRLVVADGREDLVSRSAR